MNEIVPKANGIIIYHPLLVEETRGQERRLVTPTKKHSRMAKEPHGVKVKK